MRKTPLRKVSKKRETANVHYECSKAAWRETRIRKDGFLRCGMLRHADIPHFEGENWDESGRCTLAAMYSPHHKKGRSGPLLADQRWFFPACCGHHQIIEENKRWARKHGYILYK